MTEIRLLTDEASRTRFNFVWTVEGCKLPLLAQMEGEQALRLALIESIQFGWLYRATTGRL